MNVPTRIAGFAAGIGLVFTAALGVGHAVGPVGGVAEQESTDHGGSHDTGEDRPDSASLSELRSPDIAVSAAGVGHVHDR